MWHNDYSAILKVFAGTGPVVLTQPFVAVCLCWLSLSCTSTPTPTKQKVPPNIIFIMADDLGYADIGPYGQTKIQTPHLDKMAREGMMFTQFYAGTAVCAPS
ncbi:MAG: sulfatase-like hydrolase/transferase, partial [Saprospiraceae bacterium]|nr:sulfatase-like hydrolase/transferase [Saprospiraceae bacterium]